MMKVLRVACHNAKGWDERDEACGDVNVITGDNGVGKSSFVDILCAAFSSKGDRALLKAGASEGWILVVLQDEDQTWEIRRTLKPGEVSQPRVKGSKTGSKGAPVRWLEEIADVVGMDVLRRAMTASPREQADILLQTLPLKLERGATTVAAGWPSLPGHLVDNLCTLEATNGLEAIQTAHDYLYEERTGVNRVAEDKARTVRELSTDELAPEERDQSAALADLRALAGRLTTQIHQAEKEEQQRLVAEKDRASRDLFAQKTKLQQKAQAEIDDIQRRLAIELDTAEQSAAVNIDLLNTESKEAFAEAELPLRTELVEIGEAIARTEERVKLQQERQAARAFVQRAQQEHDNLKERADEITAALKRLQELKAGLLEKLPIKGLEFRDGQAYLRGVPLQEVNTAQAAKFWIRVAALRAAERDLGVIALDNMEKFGDEAFAILVEQAKASGLQFFISRRTSGPLRIETY